MTVMSPTNQPRVMSGPGAGEFAAYASRESAVGLPSDTAPAESLTARGHAFATAHLVSHGATIVDNTNEGFRSPVVVTSEGDTTVFTETSTRAMPANHPFEAIGSMNLRRTGKEAAEWLRAHPEVDPTKTRFDALTIVDPDGVDGTPRIDILKDIDRIPYVG